jgi:hypothetical protein
MIKISKKLDSIANRLEMSGLKIMAMEIDTVTNTIEASQTLSPGLDRAVADQIDALSGSEKQEFDSMLKKVMDSTGGDPEKIKSVLKREFGSSAELIEEAKESIENGAGDLSKEAVTITITPTKVLAGIALLAYLSFGSPGMEKIKDAVKDKLEHTQLEVGGISVPTSQQVSEGVAAAIANQIIKDSKVQELVREGKAAWKISDSLKDIIDDYTSNSAVASRLINAPDGEKALSNLDELSQDVAKYLMENHY